MSDKLYLRRPSMDALLSLRLSTKAREAIKVALAMTITYAIALSQGWDRPYWAGFAVAFVSLASIGQSLNRAALRMLGTLVAMVVALTIIALFAQDRWAFIVSLSLYAAVCCYLMGGSKHAYFWQVACFVTVIICIDAGPDPVNAFQTAILRAQQTGLGILVYSLVAVFLWPSTSSTGFKAAAADLAAAQQAFFRTCVDLSRGESTAKEAHRAAGEAMQAKARFDQLLDAAEIENSSVWDARQEWRLYQQQAKALIQSLERWRLSLGEPGTAGLPRLLPVFDVLAAELEVRLGQVVLMLGGKEPGRMPQPIDLSMKRQATSDLSHVEKAVVVVARSNMLQQEALSRSIFETVSVLMGFGAATAAPAVQTVETVSRLPDIDRLAHAFRLVVIMWAVWLALVYVPDLPGGIGMLGFASSLGIAIVQTPQIGVSKLAVPASLSVLFASFLYIFVMPTLSSYTQLGGLIFCVTFGICYLFAEPAQALGRAIGLAMFVVIASISNEQTYSFLSAANTALMFAIILCVFAVTAYVPWSPRPERSITRLLNRFFNSSHYLLSEPRRTHANQASRLERWQRTYHAREVVSLPEKISALVPFLDDWVLSRASQEEVQALVTSLQLLGYRVEQLLTEQENPEPLFRGQTLLAEIQAWQAGIQSTLRQLSQEGVSGLDRESLQGVLNDRLSSVETRLDTVLDKSALDQYSDQEIENFYRLLAAYHGVSQALLDYTGTASAIDWGPWREERFI